MEFVYHPDGADESDVRRWPFDPKKMPSKEAELIEAATGMTFSEWREQMQRGSMKAAHALLWVLMRRDNQGLKWENVEFTESEVFLRFTDDEVIAEVTAGRAIREKGALNAEASVALAVFEGIAEQRGLDIPDPAPEGEDLGETGADSDPTQPPSVKRGGSVQRPSSPLGLD